MGAPLRQRGMGIARDQRHLHGPPGGPLRRYPPARVRLWPSPPASVGYGVHRCRQGLRRVLRKAIRFRRAGGSPPGIHCGPPSFNTVNRYIANPDLAPIILGLIERSAEPLGVVESQFAADSFGFSTCRFDRWYDAKWGKERSQREWLKAHIIVGTETNIVTSVEVTTSTTNDSPVLPRLLADTAERFTMAEVSADKAYLSDANLRHIEGYGARPYIPFKSNTTGRGSLRWRRLYAYFILNETEWRSHYHRRSNVETTFSMIKGKFGDSVRAKSYHGQVNEILLKILSHNICVLIQAIHEIGITPDFEPKVPSESQVSWLN